MQDHPSTADAPDTERRPRFLRPCAFEVIVLEGPDAGSSTTLVGGRARLLIGRSPACGLRLSDPTADAHHCSLELLDGSLRLTDRSATKATRVNGVLAAEAFLVGGELIRIGRTVLGVQRRTRQRAAAQLESSFGRVHGESVVMRSLYPTLHALAPKTGAILLEGERGVGKRLVAEELHRLGRPADAPFAAAGELTTSALFASGGLLESTAGGTLYIPEASDLDEASQHTLALAIAKTARDPAHTRIIVATRRSGVGAPLIDPLYVDFPGSRVVLPPLRARNGDVMLLARRFWSELGGDSSLPDQFGVRYDRYLWPGNIRELRVAVESQIAHQGEAIDSALRVTSRSGEHRTLAQVIDRDLSFNDARTEVLAEFERRYVERALERAEGNVGRAAAASGIARRYFHTLRTRRHP